MDILSEKEKAVDCFCQQPEISLAKREIFFIAATADCRYDADDSDIRESHTGHRDD